MNRQVIALTLFCVLLHASSVAQAPSDTSRIAVLLHDGDTLTEQFDNQGALATYRKAFALDTTRCATLWRISRAYIDIGEHLPVATREEQDEQLRTYETALAFAERAVDADRGNSMAWTRRSIAKGRIALFKGIWESVSLVKQTKADIDTALAIDSTNDVANYILGRIHAKVTEKPLILRWPLGLAWADIDDAIKYYEKAIALKPDFIMYRLDAARAYVETDQYDLAKRHLSAIDTISNQDEDDEQYRKEAADLLKEINEEGH